MNRRLLVALLAAAALLATLASPAFAHGDHDARLLAGDLTAGSYRISLWQVYPESGDEINPHLIVVFDAGLASTGAAQVTVAVNATPVEAHPSLTTPDAWETSRGLAEGDVVTVTITDGAGSWVLEPMVVSVTPTSMLPMRELIYLSTFLTLATALWVAGRTARAWRRPAVSAT